MEEGYGKTVEMAVIAGHMVYSVACGIEKIGGKDKESVVRIRRSSDEVGFLNPAGSLFIH